MQIHDLKISPSKKNKRVGRGGKKGTYSGRGGKGQTARSGFSSRATFEGGMSTLIARTKKLRGFKSLKPKNQIVNLQQLDAAFNDGDEITVQVLADKKLVGRVDRPVKILSEGTLTKKIVIDNILVSAAAKTKIEKSGGEVKQAKAADEPKQDVNLKKAEKSSKVKGK